ncbi:hypothetical protein ACN42_g4689 [Penicillium freii]|uniref:Uncharacterized protein n=1 Tax=Penicillium freii TaxID=48697 RepID=A0A101MKU8_PENFR|nr:hypothetical protein ACN42_g4689 [Penicillium freii]
MLYQVSPPIPMCTPNSHLCDPHSPWSAAWVLGLSAVNSSVSILEACFHRDDLNGCVAAYTQLAPQRAWLLTIANI